MYKVGLSAKVISSKDKGLGDQEDASKQGRIIDNIDAGKGVTLVDETQVRNDEEMFDTGILNGEEVFVGQDMAEKEVSVADPVTTAGEVVTTVSTAATITPEEVTLAQALVEIKTSKPKAKGNVFKKPSESTTTTPTPTPTPIVTPQQSSQVKDKVEEWYDIQAKIEADQLLAKRLQAREQEELTIDERAKLFQQLLKKRRKFLAAKRAEENRNRPPTKAQQRRSKKAEAKVLEESSKAETTQERNFKRAREELEQKVAKKQKIDDAKVDDDQEEARMKELINIVPDEEEVAIDAIPLATKPPCIIDWKIIKEGKISQFQIIRVDGSSKRYSSMIQMLKNFDRDIEYLETLWKLVKAKHGLTRIEKGYDKVLWGNLMTMFEPDIESPVWKTLQNEKVSIWKLFDSCGVHFLRLQSMHIFMLVEKRYPLTLATITGMLNKKLQADH
ncbi:hypothetical protein Tco_1326835 [Tanacetum coccineum]